VARDEPFKAKVRKQLDQIPLFNLSSQGSQ